MTSKQQSAAARMRGMAWGRAALALAATALVAGCGGSGGGSAAVPLPQTLAEGCPGFDFGTLPHGARITQRELRQASDSLPRACIVRGEIVSSPASTIRWVVELPEPAAWNGKTLTIGGGAFDGFIPTDDAFYQELAGPTAHPFVKISSDSGHQTRDFSWAVDDVALRNHAYLANHQALEVGSQLATAFYGRKPARRYMLGHSNGGRSGLMAAQRFPGDYDGIVAIAPAMAQQAHQVNTAGLMQQIFRDPANWLSPAKIALYAKAETAACDALDGLADGIIGNVAACNYVPTELLCKGADSDDCLTAGQIESIRQIHADKAVPVTFSFGNSGYPRYGRGGAATSDWGDYMFGPAFEARASFNWLVGSDAARVVTRDPGVDYLAFDPLAWQPQWTRLATEMDAADPDLSAFEARGGKLLVWYGMADACVSVYRTAQYLDAVRQRLGGTRADAVTRFFTSPSVGHNLDGPGASRIDFLAALDAWVEGGNAPQKLLAAHVEPGQTQPTLTRPACPYPQFPRYDGKGDPAKAESFSCVAG